MLYQLSYVGVCPIIGRAGPILDDRLAGPPSGEGLADVLDQLRRPDAVTLTLLAESVVGPFRDWLLDRRNRRQIPHRLEAAGYTQVRNEAAKDRLWKVWDKRQAIYVRKDLPVQDRLVAANHLCKEGR